MTLALSFSACGGEEGPEPVDPEVENGIINFVNPAADREVSANGEASCTYDAFFKTFQNICEENKISLIKVITSFFLFL